MSEGVRWSWSRLRGPLLALSLFAASAVAAACTENLEGGAACPSLCPEQSEQFRDTSFEAVVLDSSISGFPVLGISSTLLLANRPDTLVTRTIMRFDVLTTAYAPNGTGAVDSISTVDSVFLKVPLDTTGRLGTGPVTIEAFDVDTAVNDSVPAVLRSLFRRDRLIGSLTLTPSQTGDTIRVPLSKTVVAEKIARKARLRVGLRMVGNAGQLRLRAFTFGVSATTLEYDPATDTLYRPTVVTAQTVLPGGSEDATIAYTTYGLVDVGSPPPGPTTLLVGGLPSYRSYLRFNVPARIIDSSTIVRAELVLTQQPSRFASANDTVVVYPLVPSAIAEVTDLRRAIDLAADGKLIRMDTTLLVPRDSGQRVINVLALTRSWKTQPRSVPRALALRIGFEGSQPSELRFFSSEAAASLRPRLRVTFLPKSEFVLP